jgi:hypothetical protein
MLHYWSQLKWHILTIRTCPWNKTKQNKNKNCPRDSIEIKVRVRIMVVYTTFNNISVIETKRRLEITWRKDAKCDCFLYCVWILTCEWQKMRVYKLTSVQRLYLSTFVLLRNVCFLFLISMFMFIMYHDYNYALYVLTFIPN